ISPSAVGALGARKLETHRAPSWVTRALFAGREARTVRTSHVARKGKGKAEGVLARGGGKTLGQWQRQGTPVVRDGEHHVSGPFLEIDHDACSGNKDRPHNEIGDGDRY